MIKTFKKYIESKLIKFKLKLKTNKLLLKKAKYYVIAPYYMEGTTPDQLS